MRTSMDEAKEALNVLTKEHGTMDYFLGASIVQSEGDLVIDLKVKREEYLEQRIEPIGKVERVRVCVLMHG